MAGWATLWLGGIALLTLVSYVVAKQYIASRWMAAVTAGLVITPLVAWAGSMIATRWSRMARALADGIASIKDRDFSVSVTRATRDEMGELVDAYNGLGDRLRVERQSLYQRELMLDTVIQTTPLALVLTNDSDAVLYSNTTARQLFGEGRQLEGERFSRYLAVAPAPLREAIERGGDTLFTLEHNAICDELRRNYPAWNDERLFQTARLVNSALNAKIHTVEWTPGILAHPVLRVGMNANWWGLFGERIYKALGRLSESETISGIMGSPVNHHAAPFSLTEEFVSVYRLHPLIPEELAVYRAETGERFRDPLPFKDIQGEHAFRVFGRPPQPPTMADVFYSFGIAHPGAIRLHNYPSFLRNFFARDPESNELRRVDVATVDIMRDRERGVPRYNRFLKLLRKRSLKSFDQLSDNPQWNAEMREVYNNDIDRVDLMIGLMCEPLPKGFGFSDTAFRIFILMASRRLKSDRFFTNDYTPEIYSKAGLAWINENDMTSVLLRHFPQLAPALHRVENAFAPWRRVTSSTTMA
jgi:PAS domain-containing protein